MSAARIGAVFSGIALTLGAFGSHFLRSRIEPGSLVVFQTGVQIQFFHGIAIIALAAHFKEFPERFRLPLRFFSIGILLFSGSLYLLSIAGIREFGWITPVGGVLLIVSWILSIRRLP